MLLTAELISVQQVVNGLPFLVVVWGFITVFFKSFMGKRKQEHKVTLQTEA